MSQPSSLSKLDQTCISIFPRFCMCTAYCQYGCDRRYDLVCLLAVLVCQYSFLSLIACFAWMLCSLLCLLVCLVTVLACFLACFSALCLLACYAVLCYTVAYFAVPACSACSACSACCVWCACCACCACSPYLLCLLSLFAYCACLCTTGRVNMWLHEGM